MVKFTDLVLNERFINLFTDKNREEIYKYWDQIDNILNITYKDIGGYMGGHYDKESFINDIFMIKMVRKDNKIVAFRAYKDKFGRKAIASGNDGTQEGKKWVIKIFDEDLKFSRAWSEVSGKAEYTLLKMGAEKVPVEIADKLLIDKEIKPSADGFHYTRKIGNEFHEKIILTGSSEKLIKQLEKENELNEK